MSSSLPDTALVAVFGGDLAIKHAGSDSKARISEGGFDVQIANDMYP